MAEGDPDQPKKANIRSIAATAPDDPLVDNAAHLLGEIRHSPDKIRELFRAGIYPYKNRIRRTVSSPRQEFAEGHHARPGV